MILLIHPAVTKWLKEHNKGDLFECTWAEIKEALAASGHSCPIANHALGLDKQNGARQKTILRRTTIAPD